VPSTKVRGTALLCAYSCCSVDDDVNDESAEVHLLRFVPRYERRHRSCDGCEIEENEAADDVDDTVVDTASSSRVERGVTGRCRCCRR
jgi:hypothetical protein